MDQAKENHQKPNRETELKQRQNLLQREKRNKETAPNFLERFFILGNVVKNSWCFSQK